MFFTTSIVYTFKFLNKLKKRIYTTGTLLSSFSLFNEKINLKNKKQKNIFRHVKLINNSAKKSCLFQI